MAVAVTKSGTERFDKALGRINTTIEEGHYNDDGVAYWDFMISMSDQLVRAARDERHRLSLEGV